MAIETFYHNNNCEWIDVISPTKDDLVFINGRYQIDPLLLQDTLEANHLPKYEEHGNQKFFLTREHTESKSINYHTISDISTKLSIFVIHDTIITIHRTENKSITECKSELTKDKNPITADYIALKLALKVIKSFDDESKKLSDKLDLLEDEIFMKQPKTGTLLRKLYQIKRIGSVNYKILDLSSDWVSEFRNLEISEAQLADLKDKHKNALADFEHFNSQITNLISMFLALKDQQANQVMKILAMYSVYFLPITFIAGIYGMNFKHMPELETQYGYYFTLGFMGLVVLITFIYFKTKRWK